MPGLIFRNQDSWSETLRKTWCSPVGAHSPRSSMVYPATLSKAGLDRQTIRTRGLAVKHGLCHACHIERNAQEGRYSARRIQGSVQDFLKGERYNSSGRRCVPPNQQCHVSNIAF
jgi:hypothetical protein